MICATYDYSRQGYYKQLRELFRKQLRDKLILMQIREIRKRQPMVGTKKLIKMLLNLNTGTELKIGRDYLFGLLRENNLLIRSRKRYVKTTDSNHEMLIYPNLLAKSVINKPNQAWVVDITYIDTCEGFAYLFLITDYFSRKILTHVVSASLSTEGACQSLEKAIEQTSPGQDMIHHSDHGSQYCSKKYQSLLKKHHIKVSMTGANHCYDNAVAERVNGILKQEFGLGKTLGSIKLAREAASSAIDIYNNERLHLSLHYQTPESVYAA